MDKKNTSISVYNLKQKMYYSLLFFVFQDAWAKRLGTVLSPQCTGR